MLIKFWNSLNIVLCLLISALPVLIKGNGGSSLPA